MNILLPTDFSANSRNAVVYAQQLFEEVPCVFHLLHTTAPKHQKNKGTNKLSEAKEIPQKFDELLIWLKGFPSNPKHQFVVEYTSDYLIEAVRKQVLEKNIDLIVMGTKGLTNKKTTIIGKNTSDVMLKVKCPVMAISENAVFRKHKEILFPTDYNIRYNAKMLEVLHQLISLSDASVKILEIFNTREEPSGTQAKNRLFLENSFGTELLPLQTFYRSETSGYRNLFSLNRNVDMIVMVAKNLNICQRLLHNPHKNQIPFINQLPLLMLH